MAAGAVKTTDINVTAREIDFVTQFENSWDALRALLGIARPIKAVNGTVLKKKVVTGTLEDSAAEGSAIALSHYTISETPAATLSLEKYATAVTVEAVQKWGYDVAVEKTDEEFKNDLQSKVTDDFYTDLNTGSLTGTEATWQMALAMAKGKCINKFKQLHKSVTEVVGFVNVLDVYEYLGSANITTQNLFGADYIENFMGYKTLFLLSGDQIARGKVIATPTSNLNLYAVDPSDSDFSKMGLTFTTSGEGNLIGYHVEGNYSKAQGESYALMGMKLFAEYNDGVAVITVQAAG